MSGFDDLRRQAERHFGKDVVNRIERELKKDSDGPRHIMSVDNVDFEPNQTKQDSTPQKRVTKTNEPVRYKKGVATRGLDKVKIKASPQIDASPPSKPQSANTETSYSATLIAEAIKGEYSYGKLGLILGLSSIIGGIILGLNGVAGSTSWTAKVLGLESRINDAAPGVVLFVVGLFMVWVTKPKVNMKNLKG